MKFTGGLFIAKIKYPIAPIKIQINAPRKD
jgi:hypothetical protein